MKLSQIETAAARVLAMSKALGSNIPEALDADPTATMNAYALAVHECAKCPNAARCETLLCPQARLINAPEDCSNRRWLDALMTNDPHQDQDHPVAC